MPYFPAHDRTIYDILIRSSLLQQISFISAVSKCIDHLIRVKPTNQFPGCCSYISDSAAALSSKVLDPYQPADSSERCSTRVTQHSVKTGVAMPAYLTIKESVASIHFTMKLN